MHGCMGERSFPTSLPSVCCTVPPIYPGQGSWSAPWLEPPWWVAQVYTLATWPCRCRRAHPSIHLAGDQWTTSVDKGEGCIFWQHFPDLCSPPLSLAQQPEAYWVPLCGLKGGRGVSLDKTVIQQVVSDPGVVVARAGRCKGERGGGPD